MRTNLFGLVLAFAAVSPVLADGDGSGSPIPSAGFGVGGTWHQAGKTLKFAKDLSLGDLKFVPSNPKAGCRTSIELAEGVVVVVKSPVKGVTISAPAERSVTTDGVEAKADVYQIEVDADITEVELEIKKP